MKRIFAPMAGRKAVIAALMAARKVRRIRTYEDGTRVYRLVFADRTSATVARHQNGKFSDLFMTI